MHALVPDRRSIRTLPGSARLLGESVFACIPRRIHAPLTAGLLKAFPGDRKLAGEKRTEVDQLYQNVKDDLDQLLKAARLKIANAATTLLAEKQNRDPIDERSGRDYLREEP